MSISVTGWCNGVELVDGTARLAAMNLILHGIGKPNGPSLIEVKDALLAQRAVLRQTSSF